MKKLNIKPFIPTIRTPAKNRSKQPHYPIEIIETKHHYHPTYYSHIKNQTKNIVGRKEHSTHLPKEIRFNKNTIEVLGFLQGEMSKTNRGPITICNSEPTLMNKVINWLREELESPPEEWHWYIKINLPPQIEELNQVLEEELIEHWMKQCDLAYEKRYPSTLTFIKKSTRKIPLNEGSLIIERRGPVFVKTLQNLVQHITNSILDYSNEEIVFFMRGIIAAESCINFDLKTGHRRVFITATNDKERKTYIECFRRIGIQPNECKPIKDIIISRRENIERLNELGLMSLHPVKYKHFLEMLGSYKS